MELIVKKNWVYRVYKSDNSYIISVPFGSSFVDYSRAFELNLESLDEEYLSDLAKDIHDNYEKYKEKEVSHP